MISPNKRAARYPLENVTFPKQFPEMSQLPVDFATLMTRRHQRPEH